MDIKGLTNFTLDSNIIGSVSDFTPLLLFGFVLFFALFVMFRFSNNRISIETLNYIDGGFILKSNRARIILDNRTKTRHIKPMFGKKTFYCPEDIYFKKTSGIPFIGINRELTLIVDGEDVKAVLPSSDGNENAKIFNLDYRRWLFLKEREEFLRKVDKEKLVAVLSIYAPLVIIICGIIFFTVTIFLQVGVTNDLSFKINKITEALINTIQ